jgi:hypothetical protein
MVHVAETKNQISHVTQKSISQINVGALFGSCKSLFMMNPQQSSLTSPCALDNIIVFASHGQTSFVCHCQGILSGTHPLGMIHSVEFG